MNSTTGASIEIRPQILSNVGPFVATAVTQLMHLTHCMSTNELLV